MKYSSSILHLPSSSAYTNTHITQNALFMYFNLFYICCLCGRILFLCRGHCFILYICTYLNSINSSFNKHMRCMYFNIQISIFFVTSDHILLSWRFRITASQKGYEKHLVYVIKAFFIPNYPTMVLKSFFFFCSAFFWFSFGTAEMFGLRSL